MPKDNGLLTRVTSALGLSRRATYADQVGPFSALTSDMWSLVRSQEPAEYKRAGETIRRQGFEQNAIVYACARVTADQIGTAHLEAYRLGEQATVVLQPDSSLQAFLDQPAPQLSGFNFRRTIGLHLVLYGNAFAQIVRRSPNGAPERIRIIHPERMQQILVDSEMDEISAYVWNTNEGTQVISPWTDIIHVKDHLVDPDMYFGFPRGLAALFQMTTDTEASKYVRQILSNSGVPALVFFARQGTSGDELRRAEAAWRERMVDRGERGTTRFLGGVEQMQVVGHTLKDLEFPSLRQISREDICAAFGVDPRLIGAGSAKGNEGGLSGSQYQEARRRLEQQTCHPMRVAIQDALDTTLTPEFGEMYARFSPDAISGIVETPTELAERVAILVKHNIMTLDEARRAVSLPEAQRPEHLTAAPALQTISQALEVGEAGVEKAEMESEPQEPVDAMEAEEGGEGEPSETEPSNEESDDAVRHEEKGREGRQEVATRSVNMARVRFGAEAMPYTRADLDAAWEQFDTYARALEVEVGAIAADAYRESEDYALAVLAAATEGTPTTQWYDRFELALLAIFAADGVVQRLWTRRLSGVLRRIAQNAASRLAAQMVAETPSATNVDAYIERRIKFISESVSATLIKRLSEVVAAGKAAQVTPAVMADMIRGAMTDADFIAASAKRIARTEVVGAINAGEYLMASTIGTRYNNIRYKAWISERDDRVRSSHVDCDDAGWIDIEAAFPNGLRFPHDPLGSAADVANCRCILRYSDRPLEDA